MDRARSSRWMRVVPRYRIVTTRLTSAGCCLTAARPRAAPQRLANDLVDRDPAGHVAQRFIDRGRGEAALPSEGAERCDRLLALRRWPQGGDGLGPVMRHFRLRDGVAWLHVPHGHE